MILPRPIIVLDDDVNVRRQLRDLDEPMCFFGESAAERRERLGRCLAQLKPEERLKLQRAGPKVEAIEDKTQDEVSYYEGIEALREARYKIAEFSIKRCSERLDLTRIKQLDSPETRMLPKQDLIEGVRKIEDLGSYVDEDNSTTELKTLTSCNLNPISDMLATSSRSGRCKIWTVPDMDTHLNLRGHQAHANFIIFSPQSGSPQLSPNAANLASCAMDGSLFLWNLIDENPISMLSQRQNWRITRVRYHPSGSFLATCCSDSSWRLWDLPSEIELLHQEGHSDAVFDLAFHPDGSLAASASMDCCARVWDLRFGKSIQLFEGHTKGIRSIDFSPDGYHLATGGMDNSVKVWNLRQRKLEYTIPAHLNSVTTVMFEKSNGFYLITSSLDQTVKFWSNQTWAPIKALDGYYFDDKVTNLDISMDNKYLATCYSKKIKLWATNVSAKGENDVEMN